MYDLNYQSQHGVQKNFINKVPMELYLRFSQINHIMFPTKWLKGLNLHNLRLFIIIKKNAGNVIFVNAITYNLLV